MRGADGEKGALFSYVSLEARVPQGHPLRAIRKRVDEALRELSPLFDALYARRWGRPSIPPERLLRALLLQVLYSIRSERQLVEQIDYNLLYRWFVGLGIDDPVWDATTFTRNRERLLWGRVADAFFEKVVGQARSAGLLSPEHFTVDGTVIEAWASKKSLAPRATVAGERSKPRRKTRRNRRRKRGRNRMVNFHGEGRSNATHISTTDPDARLVGGAGKETRLGYRGHVLTENRHGLIVDARLTIATGYAEWDAALEMLGRVPGQHRVTLGGDKVTMYAAL